jgi:putative transposase
MKYNPAKHHRRSIRLKGYDYTAPGAYFITLCIHQRECLLGSVVAGEMQLNRIGWAVQACWEQLAIHFPIGLDAFIVMPNHLHGIILLGDHPATDAMIGQGFTNPPIMAEPNSLFTQPRGTKPGSIGAILQSFKSVSTRTIKRNFQPDRRILWQRNYYEHIIRDDIAFQRIRAYIQNNPASWQNDRLGQSM